MINIKNILEEYPKLDMKLPQELNRDEFEFIKENMDLYSDDDTIKKYIDVFIQKLNVAIANKEKNKIPPQKDTSQKKEVKEKQAKEKKESKKKVIEKKTKPAAPKAKKQAAQKRVTPKEKPTAVEHFSIEEKFMKRYLLLDGKVKTKSQILNFVKALQKAITEKQISKKSKYAKDIEKIQSNMVRLYNSTPDNIKGVKISLEKKTVDELEKLVGNKKVRLSVSYIKRFINLYGKETKEKVKRLLSLIKNAIEKGKIAKSDPYFEKIKRIEKVLDSYQHNEDIEIDETELRGLAGIAGVGFSQKSIGKVFNCCDVVSSLELKKAVFSQMSFTGIWKKMIGTPEKPFHIMIYGAGGKGKSTFAVKFATYLSKDLACKSLYVADEEKISKKLKNKLQIFNSYNENLELTGKIPGSIQRYDVVILDSVTSMGMEPEEFEVIKDKNPNVSFVYILQTNKQGNFYGKKKWEHLCDVVLRFEDGIVNVEKNRFGDVGEYEIE